MFNQTKSHGISDVLRVPFIFARIFATILIISAKFFTPQTCMQVSVSTFIYSSIQQIRVYPVRYNSVAYTVTLFTVHEINSLPLPAESRSHSHLPWIAVGAIVLLPSLRLEWNSSLYHSWQRSAKTNSMQSKSSSPDPLILPTRLEVSQKVRSHYFLSHWHPSKYNGSSL